MRGRGFKNKTNIFFGSIYALFRAGYLLLLIILIWILSLILVFVLVYGDLWLLHYMAIYNYLKSLLRSALGAIFVTFYLNVVFLMLSLFLSGVLTLVLSVLLFKRKHAMERVGNSYVLFYTPQPTQITPVPLRVAPIPITKPIVVAPSSLRGDRQYLERVLSRVLTYENSPFIKFNRYLIYFIISLGSFLLAPEALYQSLSVSKYIIASTWFWLTLLLALFIASRILDKWARVARKFVSAVAGDKDVYDVLRNILSQSDLRNPLASLEAPGMNYLTRNMLKFPERALAGDWAHYIPLIFFMIPWLLISSLFWTLTSAILFKVSNPYILTIIYLTSLSSTTIVSYLLALIIRPFVSRYVGVDPLKASAWVSSSFVAVASILYPLVVFVNPLFTFAIALATLAVSVIASWTFTEDWGKAVEVGVIAWLIMIAVVALVGYIAVVKVGLWRLLWGSI
jgi:hypothetical protein